MQKSLIIFDLDGTLIDSVPDLADAVDIMLNTLGKSPAGESLVRDWVGNGSVKLVERALLWSDVSLDNLAHAHTLFLQAYATCHHKTREYHGVTQGLNQLLAHGVTLALCTNKPTQFLPDILTSMGWADKFACVIGGDSLPTKKPDPAPLWYICDTLDIDKSHAIMVGDSKNDILAGQNAGITTLALTYGYNYGEPIANSCPDGVFDSFTQLAEHLLSTLPKQ